MKDDRSARRDLVWLFGLALAVRILTALPMQQPGYMDVYYYVDGGLSLYQGRGFSESFIWNYLDAPAGLPRPGHLYWMPLSSILVYLSFLLFDPTFGAAQAPFVLLSAFLPLLSYRVAWAVARRRRHAWCAALFTVFGGYYVAFWPLPDNFAPFAVAGALCLFALGRGLETNAGRWFAVAGICAGMATLARSDGMLLAGVAFIVALLTIAPRNIWRAARHILTFTICYLLILSPWLIRNVQVSGQPLAGAGMRTLWLTNYDDLFSYGKDLSWQTYLSWGWKNIIDAKLWGLWHNLQTLLAVDWVIVLAPFGLIGVWRLRRRALLAPAWLYGLGLYLAMSLGFTFPGVRGAMLHSSVALLPFLFAASMSGLDAVIVWIAARRRHWRVGQAQSVFSAGLVLIVALLSGFLYAQKLPLYRGVHVYETIAAWLQENAPPQARVLVNDPAAFYYYSQRQCVVVPNGDVETLLLVADRYAARYLILDQNAPTALQPLYRGQQPDARFKAVKQFRDRRGNMVRVYRVEVGLFNSNL